MTRRIASDVAIIGAGPAGMVAALCLARLGVESTVFDSRVGPARHPKAHEVSSRSLEILLELGIPFEELDAEASPYDESARVVFCGTLDDEIGRIELAEGGADAKYREHVRAPKPFLNLSQTELERVLEARVKAEPKIRFLLGHKWESMVEADGAITSTVRDVATDLTLEIRARCVLCADGAGSRSRRALGIRMEGPESIQDFVNAYFEYDLTSRLKRRAKLFFSMDPGCAGTFVAHHGERRWVYHVPVHGPEERPEDYDAEELTRRIERAIGGRAEGLVIRSIETWRMTAQVAERYRAGRAFLVGDAAHRFPPTGGLGMNTGIGDAHNLAWKVAMVLRGEAEDALLDTYEVERRPVTLRNAEESTQNFHRLFEIANAMGVERDGYAKVMRMRGRALRVFPRWLVMALFSVVVFFARLGMRAIRSRPNTRAALATAVESQRGHFDRLGLDFGATYDAGAIVEGDSLPPKSADPGEYLPSTCPGARLPNLALEGGRCLHDVLDARISTMIVGAHASRWSEAAEVALPRRVRIVPLGSLGAGVELGIGDEGALVVRPDGYVLARFGADDDARTSMREVAVSLSWRDAHRPSVALAV